jgi:hypothetical protein
LLRFTLDDYIEARDTLLKKDLIAFDGTLFQVLDLPPKPDHQEHQQNLTRLINQFTKEVGYAG